MMDSTFQQILVLDYMYTPLRGLVIIIAIELFMRK